MSLKPGKNSGLYIFCKTSVADRSKSKVTIWATLTFFLSRKLAQIIVFYFFVTFPFIKFWEGAEIPMLEFFEDPHFIGPKNGPKNDNFLTN